MTVIFACAEVRGWAIPWALAIPPHLDLPPPRSIDAATALYARSFHSTDSPALDEHSTRLQHLQLTTLPLIARGASTRKRRVRPG